MDKIDFISAFIGAIIGVSISGIYSRISTAIGLNRIRNVILDYCKYIGLDKSSTLVEDYHFIKGYILANTEEEILKYQNANHAVDAMPMFSSEIFKSFSQENLRRVSYSSDDYIRIIDISYSIDFLRDYLPLNLYENYHQKVVQHMEEKKIPAEEELKHFAECGYLKSLASKAANEIDMKNSRGKQNYVQFQLLVDNLKGNNFKWILKYIIKQ
jgi:hypothetical protein|tara:strand:- start:952 stop:1590 length:639 start_codon:yes stop_codon:yes gene_type:complete